MIVVGVKALATALGLTVRTCERMLADDTLKKFGLVELNRLGKIRRFDSRSVDTVNYGRRTGGLRAVPSRRISA